MYIFPGVINTIKPIHIGGGGFKQFLGRHNFSKSTTQKFAVKAWFPLNRLRPRQRPRQRPISSQNKTISVKDDCPTL